MLLLSSFTSVSHLIEYLSNSQNTVWDPRAGVCSKGTQDIPHHRSGDIMLSPPVPVICLSLLSVQALAMVLFMSSSPSSYIFFIMFMIDLLGSSSSICLSSLNTTPQHSTTTSLIIVPECKRKFKSRSNVGFSVLFSVIPIPNYSVPKLSIKLILN